MSQLPIDWRAVVDEAKERRKQEGLSQRDLAALAGVSAPTVNSFERGEINLRLDKVVAILESLNLFIAPSAVGSLEAFAQSARRNWEELVAELPADHPSRQPHGHSEQYYELEGLKAQPTLNELRTLLLRARRTTGWSPFLSLSRQAFRPVIRDNAVECWLGRPEADSAFPDPAHSDYWQVAREGRAYLKRGFQEDGEDFEPGTVFDVTLPIWRTGEVLVHAAWLAEELGAGSESQINFTARYTGLNGRRLLSWAKPLLNLDLAEWHRSRTDSVTFSVWTTVSEVKRDLAAPVERALHPLYERFDGFEAPTALYQNQIKELLSFSGRLR
jgi:transcriptional regulator with XRE-family HTH domain